MVNILAVRRSIAAIALIGLLSACSSGGGQSVSGVVLGKVKERFLAKKEVKKSGGGKLTRAAIEKSGGSAIYIRLKGDKGRTFMSAVSVHAPYVTFISRFGQSITLNGNFVTASRGMGADLLAASSSAGDPLVRSTPIADWPARVTRRLEHPGDGPAGTVQNYVCTSQVGQTTRHEIVEVVHDLVEITETCKNQDITFENVYFADQKTGFVWRSKQWLGVGQGWVDLEIIEPYTGG